MVPADTSLIGRLRRFDRRRSSLPGEHWLTFAAGLYFLARRRPPVLGRVAAVATGGALLARALSGRDGPFGMLRRIEQRERGEPGALADGRFVDVASPWPHRERVRLTPADSGA